MPKYKKRNFTSNKNATKQLTDSKYQNFELKKLTPPHLNGSRQKLGGHHFFYFVHFLAFLKPKISQKFGNFLPQQWFRESQKCKEQEN